MTDIPQLNDFVDLGEPVYTKDFNDFRKAQLRWIRDKLKKWNSEMYGGGIGDETVYDYYSLIKQIDKELE